MKTDKRRKGNGHPAGDTGKSVEEITREHWRKYGRSYYLRFDFDGIPTDTANKLMSDLEAKLPPLNGQKLGSYEVAKAEAFVYNDPVDHSSTQNGLRILFTDGSRIVYRLSGTSSSGATLRVYIEKFSRSELDAEPRQMVDELLKIAAELAEIEKRTGKKEADVTT